MGARTHKVKLVLLFFDYLNWGRTVARAHGRAQLGARGTSVPLLFANRRTQKERICLGSTFLSRSVSSWKYALN